MMALHLFGGVSSPSCANFALKKTAEDNRATFSPQAAHTVKHNFYVDDCLSKELRELLSKGGFRLTKWLSNSRRVVESIPEAERAAAVKNLDFEHPIIERALGVQWQVGSVLLASASALRIGQPLEEDCCLPPALSSTHLDLSLLSSLQQK